MQWSQTDFAKITWPFMKKITSIAQKGMTSSMECEKSRIEKLRELKELLDEGILTQEEFCAEKKRVLEK